MPDCTTPDNIGGNCINFRFCSHVVNLIIKNQQKRDEIIETYIKKSICGYDGTDPKVCCPALIFAGAGAPGVTQPTTSSQPGPFIFSSVNPSGTSTITPQGLGQPTFSPLQPTPTNPAPPTNPSSPPNPVIFSPVGPSTLPPPIPPTPTTPPQTTPGAVINRLPTYDIDKCGVSTAVRSRIVGYNYQVLIFNVYLCKLL